VIQFSLLSLKRFLVDTHFNNVTYLKNFTLTLQLMGLLDCNLIHYCGSRKHSIFLETVRYDFGCATCVLFQGLKNQIVPWKVELSSDLCQLSLCSGVLNALSISELCGVHPMTGEPIINFIFHHLFDISKRYLCVYPTDSKNTLL
jgi:hypothetical protein